MADVITDVLALTKIDVGGSDNTWGVKINDNTGKIDAAFDTSFKTFSPGAFDLTTFINGKVTLSANTAFATPTDMTPGRSGTLRITQDGTGGRTATFSSAYDFGIAGTPTLSTTGGVVDRIYYQVDDGGAKLDCTFKAGE